MTHPFMEKRPEIALTWPCANHYQVPTDLESLKPELVIEGYDPTTLLTRKYINPSLVNTHDGPILVTKVVGEVVHGIPLHTHEGFPAPALTVTVGRDAIVVRYKPKYKNEHIEVYYHKTALRPLLQMEYGYRHRGLFTNPAVMDRFGYGILDTDNIRFPTMGVMDDYGDFVGSWGDPTDNGKEYFIKDTSPDAEVWWSNFVPFANAGFDQLWPQQGH